MINLYRYLTYKIQIGYVHNEHFFIMLRNQEKNSVVRGIFLVGGWGLGLDRFYEGD